MPLNKQRPRLIVQSWLWNDPLLTDTTIVHQLENDYPSCAANFANWAEQGLGGAQQAVWTALAEQGIER